MNLIVKKIFLKSLVERCPASLSRELLPTILVDKSCWNIAGSWTKVVLCLHDAKTLNRRADTFYQEREFYNDDFTRWGEVGVLLSCIGTVDFLSFLHQCCPILILDFWKYQYRTAELQWCPEPALCEKNSTQFKPCRVQLRTGWLTSRPSSGYPTDQDKNISARTDGISRVTNPAKKFFFSPYNKYFIDQACSVTARRL